jgi:hypothetical protein
VRQQHAGLADRHQETDERRRHAEHTEQPRQRQACTDQFVGDLVEQVRNEVGKKIARLVGAGIVGDVLADARILIAGDLVIQPAEAFLHRGA